MFDIFADKKLADKLAKEDRSFAKKLSNHISNIISEMKRAIAAFAAGKDKIEIKALYNDIEKLDKIREMIETGINYIPNLSGLIDAINKKESSSQYLADLQEIHEAYAQSVKENYPKNSLFKKSENVNSKIYKFF